jgi:hypothetical protein
MNAITYPARPINGGQLEKAPPKSGSWIFEPKYNGWRTLVHCPSGTMFNRHGERLSIGQEFSQALQLLRNFPYEWLDCEALDRRHQIGRGSLMVFDWVSPELLNIRKQKLHEALPAHQVDQKPEDNKVYSVRSWSATEVRPLDLYHRLMGFNRAWACVFYEGLIFKRSDLPYPVQLRSARTEFPGWVKHRWIPRSTGGNHD